MINLKRKPPKETTGPDNYQAEFQDAVFATLSEIIASEDLEKSISAILDGTSRAFDCATFLFKRNGNVASLERSSNAGLDEIAALLRKAGIRIASDKIPLSGGREKVFDLPYVEHDSAFALLGDMATSAVCRKIQSELQFNWIAAGSVKLDSGDLAILILMQEKPATLRRDLGRFTFLLKSAYWLSSLKTRLRELETQFDEQFIKLKKELEQKESGHSSLFNEMSLAAAVLDERGVIAESNGMLRALSGKGSDPVGQSFASLINEEGRREFIEFVMNITPGADGTLPVAIGDRHFKAYIVGRSKEKGGVPGAAIYLSDDTAEVALKRELGETIDALRSENEAETRIASEAKKYSDELITGSGLPLITVSAGVLVRASEPAKKLFEIRDGEKFEEFASRNGIKIPSGQDSNLEISDNRNRTFSVTRWQIAADEFLSFHDVSELRKLELELHRTSTEAARLFNGFLPTAEVRNGKILKWNDMFESLFKDSLGTDRSLDTFLQYLGEAPSAFRSELKSENVIMRMCRTTDRKYLNLSATAVEETIFLFLEDITEQENLKQQLRATQALLTSALESSLDEPIFVVENGVTRATNIAARSKLSIVLDEPIEPVKILAGIGIVNKDDIGELNGSFYRVETASVGNAAVYRFRTANQEMAQRADIEKLRRRQEILKALAVSERFEEVLKNLNDLLGGHGYVDAKVVGTGTVQASKEAADVYLLTTASEKIEPSLSLSVGESDIAVLRRGGAVSRVEVPDTTLMNVISAGDSALLVQSKSVGDTIGFASVAIADTNVPPAHLEEIAGVLKVACSVSAGLYARKSAERKFEDSGKITRAIVGLTGIGEGTFEEISRRSIDMLRQVYNAEAVGVYSVENASMRRLVANGELPEALTVPGVKFGSLTPQSQLDMTGTKTGDGSYFAVKSRSQKLALFYSFAGVLPAPSELSAVSSVGLDFMDSRRAAEDQAKVSTQLLNRSKLMSEFMSRLSKASSAEEVVKILGDSLASVDKEAKVAILTENSNSRSGRPMELVESESNGRIRSEANFISVGMGVLSATFAGDPLSRVMVGLSVDKIRSIFALKLPAAQSEAATLRSRLDRARDEYSKLRDSVDRMPASLRNARIAIDNAISRLNFVQGDEKMVQEIKLHLATAAKEMSVDLDQESRNQDELFEAVRIAVMGAAAPGQPKVHNFDTSVLTEFRADPATFDVLKDLFANFVMISGPRECEVLLMTAQPSPNEAAEAKGKHVGIRITGGEGEILRDETARSSSSMQTLIGKLEKLGYAVDMRAIGNELTMDICEKRLVEAPEPGELSALLVEDDKSLVEEESQLLLQVFSRLKVAGDAVEAAKIFETEKFTAAFVDLSLPSINGREICRQIKKSQPECVTVLLTNREGEERSEGVDRMALRPLQEDAVRQLLPVK